MPLKFNKFNENSPNNEKISKNFLNALHLGPIQLPNFHFTLFSLFPRSSSCCVTCAIMKKNLSLVLAGSSQSAHADFYSKVHQIAQKFKKIPYIFSKFSGWQDKPLRLPLFSYLRTYTFWALCLCNYYICFKSLWSASSLVKILRTTMLVTNNKIIPDNGWILRYHNFK